MNTIHSSPTVTVFAEGDDVIKVYKSPSVINIASELSVCRTGVGLSVNVEINNNQLKVTMKKGHHLTSLTDSDVYDLIRHLARMEAHGLVHGDIKPSNIVKVDERVYMIDYGLLTTRDECECDLQSFKDKFGYARKEGFVFSHYSAMSAAMYALGVTLCVMRGLIPLDLITNTQLVPLDVDIDGKTTSIHVLPFVSYIDTNLDVLCKKLPIVTKLLCHPKERYKSFWQLIPTDVKKVYNKCVSDRLSCRMTAIIIQGYLLHGITDIDTLVTETKGQCMYWFRDKNQTLRLLREYNEPGSWFMPCGKCESVSELMTLVTGESPPVIVYCFGSGTSSYIERDVVEIDTVAPVVD